MLFGKRTKQHDFGEFTGDACPACQTSQSYRFGCITHYIVLFFLNLIPISQKHETVCAQCGDTQALDGRAGRSIAKKFFARSYRKLFAADLLKAAAVAAVIAAAVALPFALQTPAVSPDMLKSLVSEDGIYIIQNGRGDTLGIVNVSEGQKQLLRYHDISALVGEPGASAGFYRHDYYSEGADAALLRITDDAGVLRDKHGTVVRYYYYISYADTLGYSRGVEDLSAISYTPDKVTYPFSYYQDGQDGPTPYTHVIYFPAGKKIEAAFVTTPAGDQELTVLSQSDYQNGRVLSTTQYELDRAAMDAALKAGISPQSTADDVLAFIGQQALPSVTKTLTYHGNTRVVTSATWARQDTTEEDQSFTQAFAVTEKNGFFILTEKE